MSKKKKMEKPVGRCPRGRPVGLCASKGELRAKRKEIAGLTPELCRKETTRSINEGIEPREHLAL